MANDALFIGWGAVVRGREETSLQVFQETIEFWAKAQQDGRISGFEPYLLQPHGGDLAGFMLLYGERARLDELRASADFERLMTRAGAVVDDLGVVTAYGGESLARQIEVFRETARELA